MTLHTIPEAAKQCGLCTTRMYVLIRRAKLVLGFDYIISRNKNNQQFMYVTSFGIRHLQDIRLRESQPRYNRPRGNV